MESLFCNSVDHSDQHIIYFCVCGIEQTSYLLCAKQVPDPLNSSVYSRCRRQLANYHSILEAIVQSRNNKVKACLNKCNQTLEAHILFSKYIQIVFRSC